MDTWLLVLVIAIPFLFLIGVVNNAVKDQKKLEERHNKFMADRGAVPTRSSNNNYDDDDWGVPERQDLRRMEEAPDAFKKEDKDGKKIAHATNYFSKYNREESVAPPPINIAGIHGDNLAANSAKDEQTKE